MRSNPPNIDGDEALTESAGEGETVRAPNPLRTVSFLFIAAGVVLILENYGYLGSVHRIWPILSFLIGIGLCLLFTRGEMIDIGVLVLGTFISLSSIMFLYCNYVSWSVLRQGWPIFIGFMGLSFFSPVVFGNRSRILLILSFVLISLCIFFFLVFSVDVRLWPFSLIILGLSLKLIRRYYLEE